MVISPDNGPNCRSKHVVFVCNKRMLEHLCCCNSLLTTEKVYWTNTKGWIYWSLTKLIGTFRDYANALATVKVFQVHNFWTRGCFFPRYFLAHVYKHLLFKNMHLHLRFCFHLLIWTMKRVLPYILIPRSSLIRNYFWFTTQRYVSAFFHQICYQSGLSRFLSTCIPVVFSFLS